MNIKKQGNFWIIFPNPFLECNILQDYTNIYLRLGSLHMIESFELDISLYLFTLTLFTYSKYYMLSESSFTQSVSKVLRIDKIVKQHSSIL